MAASIRRATEQNQDLLVFIKAIPYEICLKPADIIDRHELA